MLQELVGVGHEIIRSTWTAASILVKYYLLFIVAYLFYTDSLSVEEFRENILDNSRAFIFALLFAGMFFSAFQIEVKAFSSSISQMIALAYLGYLFWVY